MNTRLIPRLFWKEFRQQRAFWLSLYGGAIGLIMLLLAMNDYRPNAFWACCSVAFFLPICFALGSVAMAFAGERDDHTDVLLCRLAAPPISLLLVKLTSAILGAITMWLLLAPTVSLIMTVDGTPIPFKLWLVPQLSKSGQYPVSQEGILETATLLSWLIGFLSWGLCFSLICQRVTTCLIASLLATAAVTPLIQLAFEYANVKGDAADLSTRLVVVPAILLATSIWLARRWPEGRLPAVVERSCEWLQGLKSRGDHLAEQERKLLNLEQDMRSRFRSVGLSADAVDDVTDRAEQRDSRSIRLDNWLTTEWRAVWRVAWLELKRARRVLILGLVVIVGTLVLTGSIEKQRSATYDWLPNMLFGLSALACGLSTMLPEHRQRQFSFFSHNAASPSAVWVTKQCIWWTLAVALAVSPFLVAAMTHRTAILTNPLSQELLKYTAGFEQSLIDRESYIGRFWYYLRKLNDVGYYTAPNGKLSALILAITFGRWVMLITLIYSLGQFVGVLIPRAIVAIGVGLIGSLFAVALFMASMVIDVPMWLSIFPTIAILLFAAWLRWRDWLNERRLWPAFGRAAAAFAVPLLATYLAVGWYRVAEIPVVNLRVPSGFQFVPPAAAEETARLYVQASAGYSSHLFFHGNDESQRPTRYDEFSHIEWHLSLGSRHLGNPEQVKDNEAMAWKVEEIARRPDCYFKSRISADDRYGFVSITPPDWTLHRLAVPIKFLAMQLAEDGATDKALRLVQTLRNMARHARQHQGRIEAIASLSIDMAALDVLRVILAREPLTHEQTLIVQPMLTNALLDDDWEKKAVMADWLITMKVFELTTRSKAFRFERWFAPWEITRLGRVAHLIAVKASHRAAHDGTYSPIEEVELRGWSLATHGIHYLASANLMRDCTNNSYFLDEHTKRLKDVATWLAACRVMMSLKAHQKQNGKPPDRLEEQTGLLGPFRSHDPWTEQGFSYWPNGLPVTVRFSNETIKAGTPCFFSGGVHRARLLKQDVVISHDVVISDKPTVRRMWTFTSGGHHLGNDELKIDALGFALEP